LCLNLLRFCNVVDNFVYSPDSIVHKHCAGRTCPSVLAAAPLTAAAQTNEYAADADDQNSPKTKERKSG
jgi:hypothetical protein